MSKYFGGKCHIFSTKKKKNLDPLLKMCFLQGQSVETANNYMCLMKI